MSSSKIDYTPMILAQITDLQMRLTKQDETISALKAEVERLSGRPSSFSSGHSFKTSVPLQHKPHTHSRETGSVDNRPNRPDGKRPDGKRTRPQVAGVKPESGASGAGTVNDKTPYNLNELIKTNEEVTIKVGTGKDEEGNFLSTFAYATFDGTNLTVNKCELVPSLIGLKTYIIKLTKSNKNI